MKAHFVRMAQYNAWANARIIGYVDGLSEAALASGSATARRRRRRAGLT